MKMCNIHCVATPPMTSYLQKIWIGDRTHRYALRYRYWFKRLWVQGLLTGTREVHNRRPYQRWSGNNVHPCTLLPYQFCETQN